MRRERQLIPLIFILFLALFIQNTNAQEKTFTYQNLEKTVIDYYPPMKNGLDQTKYRKGKYILENTYSAIKNSEDGFVYADYWNIAIGFSYMGERKESIELAFTKAVESDQKKVCEIIDAFSGNKPVEKHGFYKSIPETYSKLYEQCRSLQAVESSEFDLTKYSKDENLDSSLVKIIAEIAENDQRYRKGKGLYYNDPVRLKNQTKLDDENQKAIETLFKTYGRYIGKSLVGKKFEATMWAVIQHSNLEKMEKYLPILSQAVKEGELPVTPLKMLIDRIYSIKYKYQIFGSQGGVDIANKEITTRVKREFGIK